MNGGVPSSSIQRVYDMQKERDIIALLQAVRVSALDADSKDQIRDIVFALHTDLDQTLLDELQMYVSPLKITIAGSADAAPENETPAPETQAVAPTPKLAITPTTPQHGSTRPAPQFGRPSAAAKSAVHAASEASVSVPAVESTPATDVATPKETTTAPEPEVPSAEIKAEPATEASTQPDAATRIAEIKATVNAKVGNPVNLIDATNEIGRSYMTALLNAMKAVNGEGSVAATMQELEVAFAAVEKALESHAREQKPAETPVVESAPAASAATSPQGGYAAAQNNEAASNDSKEAPEAAPSTPAAPAVEPVAAAPASSEKLTPISAVTPPVSTAAAESAKANAPAPVTDALMSEEVNAGLQQLLTEWKLFKSSGMLGTGPKGAAHPLYKELQNLPMNLVIAGRFEGATPDVRQSITDYMNGWRYEQGMTHDMKETFEHYLRRVVKTIIDKQAQ